MLPGETIFALSSGSPPAGIAVIRISGPVAGAVPEWLGSSCPPPRVAVLRRLHDHSGALLDQALVLWMPGPASVTGEDMLELHCHGGRALVAKVLDELGAMEGLRPALPGEFTRRGFANGRIDLAEAEGLADLLAAETSLQLAAAQAVMGGGLSQQVEVWRLGVLGLSAQVETMLDFADEEDGVEVSEAPLTSDVKRLADDIGGWLQRPRSEVLREGFRVVLAGPPNAGKSSLFNALIEDEAAIATPIEGTTRDVLMRSVGIEGIPFNIVDTAGLRRGSDDSIEAIGIARAENEIAKADLVLWLGAEGEGPVGACEVETKCDLADHAAKTNPFARVSATTGEGVADLRRSLVAVARDALPKPGQVALNQRQHDHLAEVQRALGAIASEGDLLIVAEHLRQARAALDALVGRSATEDMLDTLFGRFCIGK